MSAQLLHAPSIPAIHFHFHRGANDGITLAGHGFNQGRLSTTVRTQDGNMLSGSDPEVHLVQHHLLTTCYIHIAHMKKFCRRAKFPSLFDRRHPDRVKATWLMCPPLPLFATIKCQAASLLPRCAQV